MPTHLNALSIQFYRGIGPEEQFIGPFSKMNLFIGANNAGKSTVLNLIGDRLPFTNKSQMQQGIAENYRGAKSGEFRVSVGIPVDLFIKGIFEKLDQQGTNKDTLSQLITKFSHNIAHNNSVWMMGSKENSRLHPLWGKKIDNALPTQDWNTLWVLMFQARPTCTLEQARVQCLNYIARKISIDFPNVAYIPAERDLGEKARGFNVQGDVALIDELGKLQNPGHEDYVEKRAIFDKINRFVQEVTGKPDAIIEIPNSSEHILVHMDNKVLPLFRLGTGIQEVILIAAFCTIHNEKIVCIEEPEIHLHPLLQRKLIRYLQENTGNQYFIATHSAAFIDTPNASIFRVNNDGVQTYITSANNNGSQKDICDDLGYRASDILQSNFVVWVEGPSDRIYLRHWIKEFAPELIEGIHYSIMFYGGALISHLGGDDAVEDTHLQDFISLKRLNQNLAIILDSDKSSIHAELKPAVERIEKELADESSMVWITEGREMENYVDPDALHDALAAVHTQIYSKRVETGQFDNSFYFERKKEDRNGEKLFKKADKVKVANQVCKAPANFDVLDLKERIRALVNMIRNANEA